MGVRSMKLNQPKQTNSLCSVVEFISQANKLFDFSLGRDTGFVEYMKDQGHFYMYSIKDFMPYAKKYFGK